MLGKIKKTERDEFIALRDRAIERVLEFKDFIEAEHKASNKRDLEALLLRAEHLGEKAHNACDDVAEWAAAFASEQTDEYSEKSERWQGSERGEAVSTFIDEWESAGTAPEENSYDVADPEDGFPAKGRLLEEVEAYDMESYADMLQGLPLDASDS